MDNLGFNFKDSYTTLPSKFYTQQLPKVVVDPACVIINHTLAESMGLKLSEASPQQVAEIFSGKKSLNNSRPFAQAYAGHQFGHFNVLGDGRALVLGEHRLPDGGRVDIQFKGSGPTPYSRRGDGLAALGPMLREYIISEAMHHLGIPTTRSLAVVTTGDTVLREEPHPGAILTRVASSHIRVGTFEYAAYVLGKDETQSLLSYTINRHYPHLIHHENPAEALLDAVIEKQADLLVNWMRVGFVHGVMNTDNMTVSGETIDYGPCAFMDYYHPETVFSSIDQEGRYAFGNQPKIAQWNLARFAETLLPFFHEEIKQSVKVAERKVINFAELYHAKWFRMMCNKLGIGDPLPSDATLINDLLRCMQQSQADYTNTFRALTLEIPVVDSLAKQTAYQEWYAKWQQRLEDSGQSHDDTARLMKDNNPMIIPRNHVVETVLSAAESGEFAPLQDCLSALETPYEQTNLPEDYLTPPSPGQAVYQTYCGT